MSTLSQYIWAAPATIIGLCFVPLAWCSGGQIVLHTGVLEISGGAVAVALKRFSFFPIRAITFGHCVLGIDRATMDRTREHERVHVAQYQRWGPLFIPLYLLFSLIVWFQGKKPYRDNPFEREAYDKSDPL